MSVIGRIFIRNVRLIHWKSGLKVPMGVAGPVEVAAVVGFDCTVG